MDIKTKIKRLRRLMNDNTMDAYIIPSSDPHLSEYVAAHFKCREWVSGFTGSAGTVVITLDDAGLWTDGRYYIQAEKQLRNSGIQLFRAADLGVPSYIEWLKTVLPEKGCIGLDGNVFSANSVNKMESEFRSQKISLKMDLDLIGMLWEDRPALPSSSVFVHDVQFAGKSRVEKLNEVRAEMKTKGSNYYLLTSLDDIAWLLNIRGADVPNNPVTIANVLLTLNTCYLLIDPAKVPSTVKSELEAEGIQIKNYQETAQLLRELKDTDSIMLDPDITNASLYKAINIKASKIECPNPTTLLKAVKNKTELENLRSCEIADGVAMVKFLKWLKSTVGQQSVTELSVGDKLEEFRRQNELCVDLSFDTIAGYKDHAAMMHFKATSENTYTLKSEGLLLVDSGGQYYNGTTDITRTIVLGKLTEEEKRDFTLVLKSHITLATAKFLYGTTGPILDGLARQPIWQYGLDYKCGTGHGVGFFLNVHEGPHRLSTNPNSVRLEEGMLITNEPGIYTEGKHGIRTENMMIVVKDEETEYGQFMKFETITFCPIDLAGVDQTLLSETEMEWLNTYNKMVYMKLSPYLNAEEKDWLAQEISH
ncbi:aminopeptidase P family protein [Desulfitobacterium metallireducens]|uniref:Peptidase M24 n=1 Tax=Desulfitobacterium metallireducens DSM 15288 TaxID=871968 RepID=W0EDT6_9FIRM|nr:aminopeptidase P family protein [Desulfitobacterium metallireducens]AHF07364.1 peptidase M24 [Desulfitobacterium metallireducens DSM 15288]